VVKDSTIVEPNSIYAGIPARKVKDIDPTQTREMIDRIANNYLFYSKWYEGDQ
jgi:carbonic anhydrase/acetyltransferase-like protein (isoleucine patch superfamily)